MTARKSAIATDNGEFTVHDDLLQCPRRAGSSRAPSEIIVNQLTYPKTDVSDLSDGAGRPDYNFACHFPEGLVERRNGVHGLHAFGRNCRRKHARTRNCTLIADEPSRKIDHRVR